MTDRAEMAALVTSGKVTPREAQKWLLTSSIGLAQALRNLAPDFWATNPGSREAYELELWDRVTAAGFLPGFGEGESPSSATLVGLEDMLKLRAKGLDYPYRPQKGRTRGGPTKAARKAAVEAARLPEGS